MKSNDHIKCPSCGESIPVSETLMHQIREALKLELSNEIIGQKKQLTEKESELAKKEKSLAKAKEGIDRAVEEGLKAESHKLEKELRKKVSSENALVVKGLQEQLEEKDEKLRETQKAELDLLRQKKELEQRQRSLELEVARKIEKERETIRETVSKEMFDDHRLKDAEKDKRISDMLQTIEELKRKGQQGSQQTQGEVLELELEEYLRSTFPLDAVEPIQKGIRGADVLQKIHNKVGQFCGSIIWESKRTKAWSDAWLQKLKDDQREARADVAILVSEALPKDVQGFGLKDGVWVTDFKSLLGLATVLRAYMEKLALSRQAALGKNEKMDALYNYLSGSEFKHKVETIVEAFVVMQQDLEKEKRQFTKSWAKRQKQIERVIHSTTGMYGDMQGIIGASMQPIAALEGDVDSDDETEIEDDAAEALLS